MRKSFAFNGLVVLNIMVGLLLLASCGAGPAEGPSSQPSAASPTEPKPKGSLTIAAGFRDGQVDPILSSFNSFRSLGSPIFDSLAELTSTAEPRPGIAERWEIAPDGKTHTFYIRKGVNFHNGDGLTGADVKFSLERMLGPGALHSSAPPLRSQIASVDLKDAYTVVLNLKVPEFELLGTFTDFSGISAVVPKKYIEEKGVDNFRKNPIGSGPWKFVSQELGSRLELEANENYWGEVPKFKSLTVLDVKEEAAKVAMLKTGELDAAEVAPDSVAGLKAAGLRIVVHSGGAQFFAMPHWDQERPEKYALGNVKVRKALSLAINRQEMADKLYGGMAEPLAVTYVYKSAYFYDPNVLKPDPYDPEGAKKLMAEAGYPNGVKIKFWETGGGGIQSTLSLAIAGYWRKGGIDANVVPLDHGILTGTMIRPTISPDLWDAVWVTVGQGGFFQFSFMGKGYHTKMSTVSAFNPKLDELIEKVPLTVDPAQKKKMALEAAVLGRDAYTRIALLEVLTPFALGLKVGEIATITGISSLAPYNKITHAK